MFTQKQLYLYNRQNIQSPMDVDSMILAHERRWIEARLKSADSNLAENDLASWRHRFHELMEREAASTPDSARYVSDVMTRDEFRALVQAFAVDGLTEAQVFYYIMPRLTLEAQLPMLRILIDEFGAGNLKRAHTTLYKNLLTELQMPTELDYYVDRTTSSSFEFVNLFNWLTLRADDPSYFVGALTYLETSIPTFFQCYVDACDRLSINAHDYYSEHRHIDTFHAQEGLRVLKAMEKTGTLNARKAWHGVLLASTITASAFDAAVEMASLGHHQSESFTQESAHGFA
ncbi:MAG: iron-containing redox enzyme family protein [Aquisalimonadaceae bacterium]